MHLLFASAAMMKEILTKAQPQRPLRLLWLLSPLSLFDMEII
jgi:hypothetical protein